MNSVQPTSRRLPEVPGMAEQRQVRRIRRRAWLLQGRDHGKRDQGSRVHHRPRSVRRRSAAARRRRALRGENGPLDQGIGEHFAESRRLEEEIRKNLGTSALASETVPVSTFCKVRKGLSYKGEFIFRDGPALLGIGTIKEGGGFRPENDRSYGGPYKEEHVLHPGDVYIALTSQDGFLIGSPAMVPLDFGGIGITTHHDAKIDWKIESDLKNSFSG